jgi:hypothetical protein
VRRARNRQQPELKFRFGAIRNYVAKGNEFAICADLGMIALVTANLMANDPAAWPGTGRIKGDGQSKRIRHAILEKRAANLNFSVCENAGLKLDTVFRETSLADIFIEKPIHSVAAFQAHCGSHVIFDRVLQIGRGNSLKAVLFQQIAENGLKAEIGILRVPALCAAAW